MNRENTDTADYYECELYLLAQCKLQYNAAKMATLQTKTLNHSELHCKKFFLTINISFDSNSLTC